MDPVSRRQTPLWSEYSSSAISAEEHKVLAYKQNFINRHRDSIVSADPKQINSQKADSITSLKKTASRASLDLPTIGTPRLQTPEERQQTTEEQLKTEKVKSKGVEGFFSSIKNSVMRWFGLSKTAPSDSVHSPMTGSPKEVHIGERDPEKWIKFLDQLSVAIDKLIVHTSERGRDAQADGRSQDVEHFFHKENQLKHKLKDVQLMKRFIEANREEIRSNNFIANMDTDAIFKNHDEGKKLQDENLKISEELNKRLKDAKYVHGIQTVAGVSSGFCILGGIALAVATGGAAAPLALTLIQAGSSLATGAATGYSAYNNMRTGKIRGKKHEFEFALKALNEDFDRNSKHATRMTKQSFHLEEGVAQMSKAKSEVTRSMATNMV